MLELVGKNINSYNYIMFKKGGTDMEDNLKSLTQANKNMLLGMKNNGHD